MADEVRFLLILLEIILVGAAEDFPVEVTQVVARRILAMLGELHGESAERAAVHARHVSLDDPPVRQAEPLQPGEDLRIEIVANGLHGAASPLGLAKDRRQLCIGRSDAVVAHVGDQPADNIVRFDSFRFGVEIGHHAMPQHGQGHGADVVDRGMKAAVQHGAGLGSEHQILARTRAGAPN